MQELIVFVAVGGAACFLAVRLKKAMKVLEGASSCGGCSGCKASDAPRGQGRHGISVDALRRTAKR